MEFGAWFAVIDPNHSSETEPISIHDHLLRQPWFLRVESVAKQKCYIVTTRPNLPVARAWIDSNLEPMIRKSIPQGIDPPSSLLPHRLDKPVYSATTRTYADILKQQFSLAPNAAVTDTANNRPPRKRQASIIDYDSDTPNEHTSLSAANPSISVELKSPNTQCHSNSPSATTTITDYANELVSIKKEISDLTALIKTAMEQFTTAIKVLTATPPSTTAMDTEVAQSHEPHHPTPPEPDLSALISDLKHELAAFVKETRALFQQEKRAFTPFQLSPMPPPIT